jgi:hypothetical protein
VLLLAFGECEARAECRPPNGLSPCVDANSLWLATGEARWFTLAAPGPALAPGRVALAVAVQVLTSPLRWVVPSPDLEGREIRAIDRVVEQDLVLAVGLGKNLELGLSLGVILHQSGAGPEGLTAQRSSALTPSAERDPRLSLSYTLALGRGLWLEPRLALGVPLGDATAYASSGAFSVAPALPLAFHHERFAAAAELGLRLRPAVELGTIRWGSQAQFGLGVSMDALQNRWLAFAIEGFALAPLIDSDTERARAVGVASRVVVVEWLLSARSFPVHEAPWSVALGAGGGLAASTQTVRGAEEHFVAPTSPGLRALAEIRYAPTP